MIRLLLLFFIVFIASFISLILIYGTISFGMLLLVKEMGFFYSSFQVNTSILGALFNSMIIPGIMFASIVTGMCCIIMYKAIQKKQHLRVEHFITIFKSFILFTAFFSICYYIVTLMIISSGKTGLLMVLPYISVMGDFFDYSLPVMWLTVAWYWVSKYESKFINDEEEWMLR
jgi:hypothetical protein